MLRSHIPESLKKIVDRHLRRAFDALGRKTTDMRRHDDTLVLRKRIILGRFLSKASIA